ncbi:MAG: PLP-dependent aminotransferase family protein [Oscillochloridaceae bacterium]|nr:PLP-dependent aminotransferase family protein [Chloroflexaceae bacterium]MDW8392104.1 PLP-dependent aminotransferase family protein [Oscillochloridaceae bacterium]
MGALPEIQLRLRPGIIELGWGHLDPDLLPVDIITEAASRALSDHGAEALAYGAEQGPGRLINQVQARLERLEGVAPPAEQVMITGGVSQALTMLCTLLSRPGDVVLVEAPTYHLALRIFQDHGLRLVSVPGDARGMHVETAGALVQMLRAHGEQVAFLYLTPSFSNPTGAILAPERRQALADLAAREGLTVIEDDAYGELWYETPPPPPLYHLAPGGPIIRLGTFSKLLAPGLRLGWMLAAPDLVRRCCRSGMLDSGGGLNHFTATILATLLEQGQLDPHVARLRDVLRVRRDALLAALALHLPTGCTWFPVLGGYFVWVRLPPPLDTLAMLPFAETAGVAYLPGRPFFADSGGHNYLRLSFSLLATADLQEGARRLGAVARRALKAVV